MKYIVAISLVINCWFQFRDDLMWRYVELRMCKPGYKLTAVSINEYKFMGMAPLHIPIVFRLGKINEEEYECTKK